MSALTQIYWPYMFSTYIKTLAIKKWLPFELIYAVHIVTLNSSPVLTWCESECGEYLDYIVTSNFSQPYPIFLTLDVQYTSRQNVASIQAYMCSIHINFKQLTCSNQVYIMNWPYMFSKPRTKL